MTKIIPERLALLDKLTIDHGSHKTFDVGHCSMEVVAWLAGEGHTDAPQCASAVLTTFTIGLNDRWDDEGRARLRPFLPRMVGTAGDGQDEARSLLALDWLIRTFAPAWLDLAGLDGAAAGLRGLRRIVDLAAAEAAGPVVRSVRQAAAGAAAGAAAWDVAGAAAWDVAGDVAGAAAWDVAGAAARDAARAAARDALQPTVETLQTSALDLLDRMIDPNTEFASYDRARAYVISRLRLGVSGV